jgi:DDE superfamily endonuclease
VVRCGFSKEFLGVVVTARVAFSKRSWPYVLAMAIPWLLCQGQRCITRLVQVGGSHRRSLSSYYRFLSDGKFRREVFWRCLLKLIVATFEPTRLLIVVDDTLCPKWGRSIFGTASFFDHVARPRPGFIWGHNWVVLAVVVTMFGAPVALPFCVQLYRPEKHCGKGEFRTRLQMVVTALETVKSWTSLPITVVADGAYNNESLLGPLEPLGIPLVSRLRHDAKLRRDPPAPRPHRRGRRPRYGKFLPSLQSLSRGKGPWQRLRVGMYRTTVTLKVLVIDAWWPACGRKMRLVIVRDPRQRRRTAYLTTTDLSMTATEVIETFAKRWSIEQLFSDVKIHLGLDSAEVRRDKSVMTHAALSFALATWIHVWHYKTRTRRNAHATLTRQVTPVSFRAKLHELRSGIVKNMIFPARLRASRSARNSNAIADLFSTALTGT